MAVAPDQAVDRKGIGNFVGDHHAGNRLRIRTGRDLFAPDHVAKSAFGKGRQRLRQAVLVGLDQAVLECRAALWCLPGESGDHVPGECTDTRPIFADDKDVRAIEAFPALRDLPRQGDAKERVSLGCGEEVAGASWPALAGTGNSPTPDDRAPAP